MNRLEELTLKFADDALTEIEAEELLSLLESDSLSREQHEQILAIEFALREKFCGEKLGEMRQRILANVHQEHRSAFTERTMSEIRTINVQPYRRKKKSSADWAAGLAIAATLALMLTVVYFIFNPSAEPAMTGAWVTADLGEIEIQQGEKTIPLTGRVELASGSILRVVKGNATIDYDHEDTQLRLSQGTSISVGDINGGKHIDLFAGVIEANVAPQPMDKPLVIETPSATSTVKGTIFRLSYEAEKSVLMVTEGAVEIVGANGKKALVNAGRVAEYFASGDLLQAWIGETKGLVSRWTFDQSDELRTPNSISGGQYGQLSQKPTLTNGVIGTALALGPRQFVEIQHTADYELTEGSISLWFQAPEPRRGMNQMLFTKRARTDRPERSAGYVYMCINERGHAKAQLYGATGEEFIVESKEPIKADQWNHLVFTFGPSGMRLFLNGQLQASDEYIGGFAFHNGLHPNQENILLGADNFWKDRNRHRNHFLGALDDVRIYNRQLGNTEIQQLAEGR